MWRIQIRGIHIISLDPDPDLYRNNHLNYGKKLKLFSVFNGFSWIQIRIIWNRFGSGLWIRIQVFLIQIRIQENDTGSTDPDLPHWCGGSVFFCPIRIRTFFFGFRLWIRKGSGSESDLKQDFVSVSEFKSFKSARRQENTTILSEIKIWELK